MPQAVSACVALEPGVCREAPPEPCGIVIFGALGDLTRRKLLPSLFRLFRRGLLPSSFFVIGCLTRSRHLDDASYRQSIRDLLAGEEANHPCAMLDEFVARCYYQPGDAKDPALFADLAARLETLSVLHGTGARRLFYLSVPPPLYAPILAHLGHSGLAFEPADDQGWSRVVIEKPLGHDLASARELAHQIDAVLTERQVFRIDHYLGKDTVQNVLVLRFANTILEPVWNARYVDHVQITVAESLGVGHRAGYYDPAGCLRDMFQHHLLQMLAMVAMEPPPSFDQEPYLDQKARVPRCIRPLPADPQGMGRLGVRGQYEAGEVDGVRVAGYVDEPGVAQGSSTETYVAMKLWVDHPRWAGVPFFVRSGKRLAARHSEIVIAFKPPATSMFGALLPEAAGANELVLNVQPEEGIALTVRARRPGPRTCMGALTLTVDYRGLFGDEPPEAYERLILDAMLGDHTLFVRSDASDLAWSLFDPVLRCWADAPIDRGPVPLWRYPAGTWGPLQADAIPASEGRGWRKAVST